MLPCLEQVLRLLQKSSYLPRLVDVLVGLEQRPDIQGLPPPEVPVDSPVERELEGAAVERQRSLSGGHGVEMRWARQPAVGKGGDGSRRDTAQLHEREAKVVFGTSLIRAVRIRPIDLGGLLMSSSGVAPRLAR